MPFCPNILQPYFYRILVQLYVLGESYFIGFSLRSHLNFQATKQLNKLFEIN